MRAVDESCLSHLKSHPQGKLFLVIVSVLLDPPVPKRQHQTPPPPLRHIFVFTTTDVDGQASAASLPARTLLPRYSCTLAAVAIRNPIRRWLRDEAINHLEVKVALHHKKASRVERDRDHAVCSRFSTATEKQVFGPPPCASKSMESRREEEERRNGGVAGQRWC